MDTTTMLLAPPRRADVVAAAAAVERAACLPAAFGASWPADAIEACAPEGAWLRPELQTRAGEAPRPC